MLIDAGIPGRESDPDTVIDRLITAMCASTDPIMARCRHAQRLQQGRHQPVVTATAA